MSAILLNMKNFILTAVLLLTFPAWSADTSMDDEISERLAPVLSNYLGDYEVIIQIEHVFPLAEGKPETKTIPISLIPAQTLTADSLQDCDENASSYVCSLAKSIKQYIDKTNANKGQIIFDIKIQQNKKLVKEFKNFEVFSF